MLLPSENPIKCHEEVLSFQPMFPPKRFVLSLQPIEFIIAGGSVEFCEATPIDLVDEPKVSLYGRETDQDLRSACRCVA